jgi:nucleoside-diphosphate-sugar epimerase
MTCADTPSKATTTSHAIRRTCLAWLYAASRYCLLDTGAEAPRIFAAAHATVSGVVNMRRVHILLTGASGVLGRMTLPLLAERGHQLATPSSSQLDLFDAEQVREAVHQVDAVLHLATRIPTLDRRNLPGAWDVNDRLRADVTRLLVDGALSGKTEVIVVPTAAFVYPPGPADESTPVADLPEFLRSALEAEVQLRRFTDEGRRGVALRLGSLYGPEAASAMPTDRYNVHLHTHDAGRALVAALSCPGGIYNVCDDTDPVSHARFTEATGWRPRQTQ